MPVIDKLATTLGRRDEIPNQELARDIAAGNDQAAVQELVGLLQHRDKNIQSDAVKVLYEIGERTPALIAPQASAFINLLSSKNNRLVWGALTALDVMTAHASASVYDALPKILDAADRGSVIAKDHAVGILIKLAAQPAYADTAFPLLLEQMKKCPSNQFPMYAENALPLIKGDNKDVFAALLTSRLDDFEKESKKERVLKILKKLAKMR